MSNENAAINTAEGADLEKGVRSESVGGQTLFNSRNITPGGHALDQSQPAFPVYHRKFGNPAPLGLAAFATTTFILSLCNAQARGVSTPNIVVGAALFYGGVGQFAAGMWEFAAGNTFGATAFTSYAGFWFSFAFIISPWSGIADAYGDNTLEFEHAIGFYLFGWFIVTVIFFIATFRSSVGLSAVFFLLAITFLLLGISKFILHVGIAKAGGIFGILTAFQAWYVAAAGLLTPESSYFLLPVGDLSKRD